MKRSTLLQAYVTEANKAWIKKQADKIGVSLSHLTDEMIRFAKSNVAEWGIAGTTKRKTAKPPVTKKATRAKTV